MSNQFDLSKYYCRLSEGSIASGIFNPPLNSTMNDATDPEIILQSMILNIQIDLNFQNNFYMIIGLYVNSIKNKKDLTQFFIFAKNPLGNSKVR